MHWLAAIKSISSLNWWKAAAILKRERMTSFIRKCLERKHRRSVLKKRAAYSKTVAFLVASMVTRDQTCVALLSWSSLFRAGIWRLCFVWCCTQCWIKLNKSSFTRNVNIPPQYGAKKRFQCDKAQHARLDRCGILSSTWRTTLKEAVRLTE